MTTRVLIGTVSHGTTNPEHVIPTFLDELRAITGGCPLVEEIEDRMDKLGEDYWSTDDADYDLEALFDALDQYSPPYCYFGAHEGNASDYGYWISFDSVEQAMEYGELPSGTEFPDSAEDGSLFLLISDREIIELYRFTEGKWNSAWASD